jgi:hypothetical protein
MTDPIEAAVEVTPAEAFDQAIAAKRAEREDAPPVAAAPPPEPPAPEPNPETPADAGVSASTAPEDDLAALPPAVRARLEKAEQDLARERSEKLAALGRLRPTQQRLAELERIARTAQPSPAAAPAAPEASTGDSYYDSPEWKEYERDWPREAAVQRKRDEANQQRIAAAEAKLAEREKALEARLARFDAQDQEQEVEAAYATLDASHPDWRELALPPSDLDPAQVVEARWQPGGRLPIAPDTLQAEAIAIPTQQGPVVLRREYYDWLSAQVPKVQELQLSTDPADAIWLMDHYKRDSARAELQLAHEAQLATTPAALVPPDPNAAAALQAHQRRQTARASAVAPDLRGGSPPAARVDPSGLPPADQFDHAMRLLRERRQQT